MAMEQAVRRLLAAAPASPSLETIKLSEARGRVLGAALKSPIDVPGHDNSAMDGYAVRVDDARDLPVDRLIAAGDAPQSLPAGSAARIFTGAPIPVGADAVVMQEKCREENGRVVLPDEIEPGDNIRGCGGDVQSGTTILDVGVRFGPPELGLAAAVGVEEVKVHRRLRVALLTTGDELAQPGEALAPGQVYDSNGPLVSALLAELGYDCLQPIHLPDDFEATREALERAAAVADVVITTGGVSVGDEDHVKPALEALGHLDLWRVAIKPGKPFAFGWVGDTPVLGLPGNPVSVFVTFLMLVRPFLSRYQGRRSVADTSYNLPAAFDRLHPAPKRREYLRARVTDGQVEIYPHQGSGVLSSAVWAEGLVCVEPGQVIRTGDAVPYLPFSELLV